MLITIKITQDNKLFILYKDGVEIERAVIMKQAYISFSDGTLIEVKPNEKTFKGLAGGTYCDYLHTGKLECSIGFTYAIPWVVLSDVLIWF